MALCWAYNYYTVRKAHCVIYIVCFSDCMNLLVVLSQASACSQGDSHTSMAKITVEVLSSTFPAELRIQCTFVVTSLTLWKNRVSLVHKK